VSRRFGEFTLRLDRRENPRLLYPPRTYNEPYDYFHIDSVDVYDDEHVLISLRNTWTVY
jgi:Arylsulfotransferase (ASST)